jgi:hypothetical protein
MNNNNFEYHHVKIVRLFRMMRENCQGGYPEQSVHIENLYNHYRPLNRVLTELLGLHERRMSVIDHAADDVLIRYVGVMSEGELVAAVAGYF